MANNSEDALQPISDGLFSERQIVLPLLLALLLTLALYLTFDYFYQPGDSTQFIDRYLSNPFCRLILFVFVAAMLYALAHYLGLYVERYHLRLFAEISAPPPALYSWYCFLSGRRVSDEDGFFTAARRWYQNARSREDWASLSEHLVLLREHQHAHNLAPLQFTVWALPLLGFIGTVVGITRSIAGLEEVVATSGAPASGGLETVLSGLSFAFDTTFIGLILVIPTMLSTLPLRAQAQKLDIFYQEILLNRLLHGPTPAAAKLFIPASTRGADDRD